MKVRILVTSPFRYNYGGKNHYYKTGNDFYLDTNNEDDKRELLHLLSSTSEFGSKVYINKNVPEIVELINLNKQEEVGTPLTEKEIVIERSVFIYGEDTPDSTTVDSNTPITTSDATSMEYIPTEVVEEPSTEKKEEVKPRSRTKSVKK
jgi:hypothetical protein